MTGTSGRPRPVLLFCPAVPLWRQRGELILDRKFYDGLQAYLRHWPGSIRLLLRVIDVPTWPAFGAVRIARDGAGFELVTVEGDEAVGAGHLGGVDVVLASADSHHNLHLAGLAHRLGVPCIYDVEYTLRTRLQMVRAEQPQLWRRLRSMLWVLGNELRLRRAMRRATSVQANGLPAFASYATRHPASIVYFDNRMTQGNCVTTADLERRLRQLDAGRPLRLAFSGRLIRAKGADALVRVAARLRDLGTPFEMHIFGTGELEVGMAREAAAAGLDRCVRLHGAVDFEKELLPFVRSSVDLFVCCHRQGDPSCTYLETYGCGVPIAGFANEAHGTMLAHRDVGWAVPIDDERGLARLIKSLNDDRARIAAKARAALGFAHENLFEELFAERMAHCQRIAASASGRAPAVAAASPA
jgi:glycosyltransferase involved in cell wall biosynthesis